MFKFISIFSLKRIKINNQIVFLTFDDGPEPGITEFVLDQLKIYNARATFFCTGHNYLTYPELIKRIISEGHTIGNHTLTHIDGFQVPYRDYVNEVQKAKDLMATDLFRPPWGALTLKELFNIRKTNQIILWELSSKDTYNIKKWKIQANEMLNRTRPGSIVLFHFSNKHADKTRQILPIYLELIYSKGFKSEAIYNN